MSCERSAELATPGALLASARKLEESAASLLARAAVLRRRADAEGAVLPTQLTHGMPTNCWARILSSVSPQERLKLPNVCAAWNACLADEKLWSELNICLGCRSSHVVRSELHALGRKAKGALRKLVVTAGGYVCETTVDAVVRLCLRSPLLEVLKIPSNASLLTYEQLDALMAACPRLTSFNAQRLQLKASDAAALLRGDGKLSGRRLSKVTVRSLAVGTPPGYSLFGDLASFNEDASALASVLESARGRGLEALKVACPQLWRAAPLRALAAGVVAAGLSSLTLVGCKLSARESSGPLGWLISHGPSLRQLTIRNCGHAFTTDDAPEADDAPLRAALQSSSQHSSLRSFTFIGCGLPRAPRAAARLVMSLVGHPTLESLDVGARDNREDDSTTTTTTTTCSYSCPRLSSRSVTRRCWATRSNALAAAPSPLRSLRACVAAVAGDSQDATGAQPFAESAAAGLGPLLAALRTPGAALERLCLSVEGPWAGSTPHIPPLFLRQHVLPAVAFASALTEFQVTMRIYDPEVTLLLNKAAEIARRRKREKERAGGAAA